MMKKKPDWNELIRSYTASKYEHPLDRRPDLWVCGYIPQAELLTKRLKQLKSSRDLVLDYGCGNGRVSRFLKRRFDHTVIGVDINPEAIRRAKSFSDGLAYRLIKPNQIPESLIPFDACICNHVFPTYHSLLYISRTLHVIYRSLRIGASLLVYVDNTNYTGVHYTSFMGGEPGVKYKSGDRLPMKIFLDGKTVMEFHDFFWTPQDYIHAIQQAGFSRVRVQYPTPKKHFSSIYERYFGVELGTELAVEKQFPPAAIYSAAKLGKKNGTKAI